MIDRARRLLPALWAGCLLGVAAIATPAPFALLERADAGRVVGRILAQEAWLALALGLLLLVLERSRARARAEAGLGSVLSTDLLLLVGTLFCTVAGYFAVQPMMVAARAGQGPLSFGQLHALSAACFALKLMLILALAWRAAAPSEAAVRP